MSESLVVSQKDNVTDINIIPFNMLIRFDEENVSISLGGGKNNTITLKGDTKLAIDGDFHMFANGEMSFITKDNKICMDAIDSQIHLNSRASKILKDSYEPPEEKHEHNHEQECEPCPGILELQRRIEILEKKLCLEG